MVNALRVFTYRTQQYRVMCINFVERLGRKRKKKKEIECQINRNKEKKKRKEENRKRLRDIVQ